MLIVVALVCQFCFASASLLRLDEDDDTYETEIRRANSKIITATAGILIAILALFAFLLPMGILGGSYYALGTISALALGFGCSLVMVIMCHVVYVLCIRSILTARGILYEDERAIQKAAARRKLLVRTLRIGGTIMLALFAVLMANQMLGPEIYGRQKDTFTDMTEFKEFMEKGAIKAWQHETLKGYGPEAIPGYECIFLDYGNDGMTDEVLLPPDFEVAQLTDGNGTVLCEYTSDPRFVQEVSWSTDTVTGEVRITAKTLHDMEKAESIHLAVQSSVLLLMVVTVIGFSGVYVVKMLRRKT